MLPGPDTGILFSISFKLPRLLIDDVAALRADEDARSSYNYFLEK